MPSDYETFWEGDAFALVGHGSEKKFPVLTYRGLKASGKKVFPVDPGAETIEGDKAYADLASLPEPVAGVILEVSKKELKDWVQKVADAGVKDLWIHMNTDTPEALELAKEKGLNTRHGTCAVMYVTPGFTFHSIHKVIMKMVGKF